MPHIGEIAAVRGIRLHNDLVGLAKLVEVIHIQRTQLCLQRGEYLAQGYAQVLGFQPVYIDVVLRHIRTVSTEYVLQARGSVRLHNEVVQYRGEFRRRPGQGVLQQQLQAANRAHARYSGWRNSNHLRFQHLRVGARADARCHVEHQILGFRALIPGLQHHKQCATVTRHGTRQNRIARDRGYQLNSRLLLKQRHHLVHRYFGAREGGGVRQLDIHQQEPLVFVRHKSGRRVDKSNTQSRYPGGKQQSDNSQAAQHPVHTAVVARGEPSKSGEEAAIPARFLPLSRLQQQSTECRAQRQCIQR